MNKIEQTFQGKKAFVAFLTGGDPDIETTEQLILVMADEGVDIVEIGIPFSDPIAEGPVIQEADERALAAGCTVDKLFAMVGRLRGKVSIPLLFMTYINPIFVYGKEKFLDNCAACGIDGLIVPDLPFEERDELAPLCAAHGVTLISMVAPTSQDRVERIAKNAEGFLYCVSSLGVTGTRSELNTHIDDIITQVRAVSGVPCAIGFGISTPEQAAAMAALSDGIIIGSAIEKLIAAGGRDSEQPVRQFLRSVRETLDGIG